MNPQFRKAFDIWATGVKNFPIEEIDKTLEIPGELMPALLLGKMNDPMWDIADMCAGESLFIIHNPFVFIISHSFLFRLFLESRPFGTVLMKDLLKRPNWNFGKCGLDILKQLTTSKDRYQLLRTLHNFIVFLKYVCFSTLFHCTSFTSRFAFFLIVSWKYNQHLCICLWIS